jgi:hydroxyacylglutathione hydrolase
VLLADGDHFFVGRVRIDVLHTPGHTPEHLCFVVTDTAGADRPMGVFSGDFVFVGDVGRPDLLERAVNQVGSMEQGARTLFASLQRFKQGLPEWVQLWPAHGAGSACGKALGAVPQTTLGYEKLFNWGLAEEDEEAFVRAVLAGQPDPPLYFAEMKALNRDGPPLLGGFRVPPRLAPDALAGVLAQGGLVADTRRGDAFAARHVPGTLSVPLGRSFTTWAGSVLPFRTPFYLVAEEDSVAEAARDLAMIGLDQLAGYFAPDAVEGWERSEGSPARIRDLAAGELEARQHAAAELVDVRNASEFDAGHIPGAINLPLGRLASRLDELPRDRPLVVHCQSGARAGVAIALLQARGFNAVEHLAGDFAGWAKEGRPVEAGAAVPA